MKVKKPIEETVATTRSFLPLELIAPHPDIGGREIDKEHAGELKESIRRNGLDTPLFIWDGGDEFPEMQVGSKTHPSSFIVAGHHRLTALKSLRKEDNGTFSKLFPKGIPVRIFTGTLQDVIALQLRENLDRKNPTAEEVLPQVIRLRDEFKMKAKDIARRVGRSEAYVSELFSIEKELGSEGVKEVVKGGVTAKHALRAAKELKAQRKAGKTPDVKGAVERAKGKTAAQKSRGAEREEKRTSFKKLYEVYKALPVMDAKEKLKIAEHLMAYVAGDRDTYPKQLKLDAKKASQTEEEED